MDSCAVFDAPCSCGLFVYARVCMSRLFPLLMAPIAAIKVSVGPFLSLLAVRAVSENSGRKTWDCSAIFTPSRSVGAVWPVWGPFPVVFPEVPENSTASFVLFYRWILWLNP